MRKCFIAVGLAPGSDGEYVLYSASRKGTLTHIIPQVQYNDEAVSIGEIASEIALTRRPANGADGEPISDEEEGGEEEEGGTDSRVQAVLLKYSNEEEEGEEGEEEDF